MLTGRCVGLALGLDLLAQGDDLGLPALLLGLLDFGFGNCRGVDGSPVLFGVANVVDLEIDDGDAEQMLGHVGLLRFARPGGGKPARPCAIFTNGAWRGPPQGHAGLRPVS